MKHSAIFCQNPTLENQEELILNTIGSLLPGKVSAIDDDSEELFYKHIKISSIDRSTFSYLNF